MVNNKIIQRLLPKLRPDYPCPTCDISFNFLDIREKCADSLALEAAGKRSNCQCERCVENEKFSALLDRIPLALANMTEHMAEREIYGRWPKESTAFYRRVEEFIDAQSVNAYEPSMSLPNDAMCAVIACDVATGGQRGHGADSAIVSGYRPLKGKPRLSWAWRQRKCTKEFLSGVIHELRREYLKQTRAVLVVSDIGGGGIDLLDCLMRTSQLIRGEKKLCVPIARYDDNSAPPNQRCFVFAQRDQFSEMVYQKIAGAGAGWFKNMVHRHLDAAIEQQAFELPSLTIAPMQPYITMSARSLEEELLEHDRYLSLAQTPSFLARVTMLLMIRQLKLIGIKTQKGLIVQGEHGMFEFTNSGRIDLAMALCYWWYGMQLQEKLIELGETTTKEDDDTPVVVA